MRTTSWRRRIISSPTQCALFYRFSYFQNAFSANGGLGFSVYGGKNVTRTHVAGFDFNTGSFSHSFRFGYLKTGLQHLDATSGTNLPLANYPLNIQMGNTGLAIGPTGSAPQAILQSDHQAKYEAAKLWARTSSATASTSTVSLPL